MANFNQFYSHIQIPDQPSGYELAPLADKGFISLVSSAGAVVNLNTLGGRVMAFTGLGMAPIENVKTPYGLSGGSLLQRTVARSRTIAIVIAVQRENYPYVQKILQGFINKVAPYNIQQTAQDMKIRFQLVNSFGQLSGTVLDTPVVYVSGLEGSTTGLYGEMITLIFEDLNPPDTVETATIQPNLTYTNNLGTVGGYQTRSAAGVWSAVATTPAGVWTVFYDSAGLLWYATSPGASGSLITNTGATTSQLANFTATPANSFVSSLIQDAAGKVYAGGNFTSPFNYTMVWNGSIWAQVGTTVALNGAAQVLGLDKNGVLYAGAPNSGGFSAPAGKIAKLSGTSWIAMGTGLTGGALLQCLAIGRGKDDYIYFGGNFTAANAVGAANIVRYNITTGLFSPLSSGVSGGGVTRVFAIETLPDGRIIIGGDFSTAGGVACSNIAIWNGTGFVPVGPGLNGVVNRITVDPDTGYVYIFGAFTQLANNLYPITANAVVWNGSLFLPIDFQGNGGVGTASIRSSDKTLTVAETVAVPLVAGGSTAIAYAGTAEIIPQIKFTGPGQVYTIGNYTTRRFINFNNLLLQAGETATLTMSPTTGITFVSSINGNILGKILPGSDITTFSLVPGTNNINVFITGFTGATKAELIYKNTHWSINAGA